MKCLRLFSLIVLTGLVAILMGHLGCGGGAIEFGMPGSEGAGSAETRILEAPSVDVLNRAFEQAEREMSGEAEEILSVIPVDPRDTKAEEAPVVSDKEGGDATAAASAATAEEKMRGEALSMMINIARLLDPDFMMLVRGDADDIMRYLRAGEYGTRIIGEDVVSRIFMPSNRDVLISMPAYAVDAVVTSNAIILNFDKEIPKVSRDEYLKSLAQALGIKYLSTRLEGTSAKAYENIYIISKQEFLDQVKNADKKKLASQESTIYDIDRGEAETGKLPGVIIEADATKYTNLLQSITGTEGAGTGTGGTGIAPIVPDGVKILPEGQAEVIVKGQVGSTVIGQLAPKVESGSSATEGIIAKDIGDKAKILEAGSPLIDAAKEGLLESGPLGAGEESLEGKRIVINVDENKKSAEEGGGTEISITVAIIVITYKEAESGVVGTPGVKEGAIETPSGVEGVKPGVEATTIGEEAKVIGEGGAIPGVEGTIAGTEGAAVEGPAIEGAVVEVGVKKVEVGIIGAEASAITSGGKEEEAEETSAAEAGRVPDSINVTYTESNTYNMGTKDGMASLKDAIAELIEEILKDLGGLEEGTTEGSGTGILPGATVPVPEGLVGKTETKVLSEGAKDAILGGGTGTGTEGTGTGVAPGVAVPAPEGLVGKTETKVLSEGVKDVILGGGTGTGAEGTGTETGTGTGTAVPAPESATMVQESMSSIVKESGIATGTDTGEGTDATSEAPRTEMALPKMDKYEGVNIPRLEGAVKPKIPPEKEPDYWYWIDGSDVKQDAPMYMQDGAAQVPGVTRDNLGSSGAVQNVLQGGSLNQGDALNQGDRLNNLGNMP